MFQELQTNFGQWMNPVLLGSWASILALVTSLYSVLWVRRTRVLLKRDREKHSLSLPEIHVTLQMIESYLHRHEDYLNQQSDEDDRRIVRRHISRAEFAVEQHLEKIFSRSPGENAFVGVARYYGRLGQVSLAILYYEKAIDCRQPKRFYLRGERDEAISEVSECYHELQSCYLAVWQIKSAAKLAVKAEEEHVGGCLTMNDIERPSIALSCAGHTVRFLARDVSATLTGRKGKMRMLI